MYPEDSGEYSCRAINEYGEAVTTASMKVTGKLKQAIGYIFCCLYKLNLLIDF